MPPKNAIQNLSGSTTSIDPFIAAATTAPQGFSAEERFEALLELASGYLNEDELALLKRAFAFASEAHGDQKRKSGEPFVIHPVEVAIILADLRMDVEVLCAALLHDTVEDTAATKEQVAEEFSPQIAELVDGVTKISKIEVEDLNDEQAQTFRKMLVAMNRDIRVVVIKLADRLHNMRTLSALREDRRIFKSRETREIYAPIAHRLGISSIKWELEDLAFFYLEPNKFKQVSRMVSETRHEREEYLQNVIDILKEEMEKIGVEARFMGRPKHLYSIYQKMKKQKCPFEGVYDLFAIRIILDSPVDKEKQECWQAYSIVTDMYQPNPKRLRDWLSVPKSNGYESLHITVMGPESKWVEVQIRTERMDDIAERGLAAHWRYKGVKGETGLDEWLTTVREALENSDSNGLEAMDQFKLDLYEDEVFVFTPKGDLFKLGKGATVLDFAFHIHSKLGCKCIGAKVNGKNAQLRQVLNSGDQVEIMTSNTQTPKQDWLNIVTSSKARTKIRQALKEMVARQHAFAKETIERKFKNRKIEYDEAVMMRLIKRLGFKTVTDFYQSIADETLDVNEIIDKYLEQQRRESDTHDDITYRSAEGYNLQQTQNDEITRSKEDVLVIDQDLKGLDFKLARCCSPIYGDDVFGFVSVTGGIKIHRSDCPNATQLRERFGYRIVKARWAGKSQGTQYPITLRVVGHDDIGIVTNITSIISKENDISLRSIGIDSHDGLFSGTMTIMVGDTGRLETLLKKLRTVKGVKQVSRS